MRVGVIDGMIDEGILRFDWQNKASISLAAGCEIFGRYVTRTTLEISVSWRASHGLSALVGMGLSWVLLRISRAVEKS